MGNNIFKMAASARSFCTFSTLRTLNTQPAAILLLRRNWHSNYKCAGIISRSLSTAEESNLNKTHPASSKSKKFDLAFEEYQKLRRKLRSTQRVAGLPIGAAALMTSSAVSAYLNPNMFDAPPEQIQPIL